MTQKSIPAIAASFLAAANLAVMPAAAAAQSSAPHEPPYVHADQRRDFCIRADYNKLIRDNDYVGIFAWGDYCLDTFRQTNNPVFLQRYAYADLALARYVHVFRRKPGEVTNVDLNRPEAYVGDAKIKLNIARQMGYDASATDALIAETEKFIHTPVATRYDPSPGAACMLTSFSSDIRGMTKHANLCMAAYNAKPFGVLAFEYAQDVFFIWKTTYLNHPLDTEGLKGALIARTFFDRADREHVGHAEMTDLNENLISSYHIRKDNQQFVLTAAAVAVMVFAVIVTDGAAAGAVGEGGTAAAGAEGAAGAGEGVYFGIAPAAEATAALERSYETARFLAYTQRLQAAMAVAAP